MRISGGQGPDTGFWDLTPRYVATVAPGSSGRGNNYLPFTLGYGKNLSPQTHLTLSQLESNIRKKVTPAEADNVVLAASPKTVKHLTG